MHVLIAPLALLLERFVGYPPALTARIGHPVMWFGALINALEQRLNSPQRSGPQRKTGGILTLAILLATALLVTLTIQHLTRQIPSGWLIEMALATPFLAQKELGRAVQFVADSLRTSLAAGRDAVSHIVGRDPKTLDEPGVCRAAIETLAENSSDGVIAPLFWLMVFGLPGIALYKAINTADSMIGHLNGRYRDFGWASARLDDVVNLIPARLTAVLFTIACFFVPNASPSKAWATARLDAKKHGSPNAGWPEAALAGALGFSLGGARSYGGEVVNLPSLGTGKRDLSPVDIARSLQLYRAMLTVTLVLTFGIALLVWRANTL